ncbi:FUSC family protein [Nocardioides campestrisoli]|uniref:FUSC family protein n=1 Tax=Nocardioides campestrisoli TaxID=2736757 RepID=UPI0015E74D35|nr:FUSC family protein [Nocardioides campestrisoli]
MTEDSRASVHHRVLRAAGIQPRLTLTDRCRAVARRWRQLLRLAAATAGAYAIATHLLGHQQAFFAPIAAVIVLVAGAGLRQRMLLELVLGVAVGVLVGELLILAIGRGAWQLALVVVLATSSALFAGLRGVAITQAANSGVLMAAVVPAVGASDPAVTRFLDALVGGLCGLAMVLLLPRNPTRDLGREVRPLLTELAGILDELAVAMRAGDPGAAETTLARARGLQERVTAAQNTAANVAEVAAMSPVRWRQRPEVARYAGALTDVDNAIRDARVLARRLSSMLRMGERCSPSMTASVEALSRGVRIFESDFAAPGLPQDAEENLVEAVRLAMESLTDRMTLNRAAVVSQIRSLAADLLFAGGMTRDELDVRLNF